ncbi:hypothetical protein [Streptomyces sp. NBC_00648]|uniref:hypothetical protein n=1 Tax=Streptomyces sp. NBC_00648 TaxID=2975797 RepID=UPI003250985D
MARRVTAKHLLEEYGRTHAEEAGIRAAEHVGTAARPCARARHAAGELGLAKTPAGLARLVVAEDLPKPAAALVRVELSSGAADALRETG